MSDKRRIGDHVQCECGHVWLYDGAVRDCPKCDSKDNFWLTVAAAGMNDRYAPLWQPGDQVADTDGLALNQALGGFGGLGIGVASALGDWPALVPSRIHDMAVRIAELEAENAELRHSRRVWRKLAVDLEEDRVPTRPLSSGWHHLPDVTAPVRDHAALWRAIRR